MLLDKVCYADVIRIGFNVNTSSAAFDFNFGALDNDHNFVSEAYKNMLYVALGLFLALSHTRICQHRLQHVPFEMEHTVQGMLAVPARTDSGFCRLYPNTRICSIPSNDQNHQQAFRGPNHRED